MTDRLLKKTYVHHLNHLRDYVFTQYALRSVLKKSSGRKERCLNVCQSEW